MNEVVRKHSGCIRFLGKICELYGKGIMRKRIYFLSGFIILFIAAIAFLNFQMDDERYYGLYDYVSVPENADFSGG